MDFASVLRRLATDISVIGADRPEQALLYRYGDFSMQMLRYHVCSRFPNHPETPRDFEERHYRNLRTEL